MLKEIAHGKIIKESGLTDRQVVLCWDDNAIDESRPYSTHIKGWNNNGQFYVSGHYDLSYYEGYDDFFARRKLEEHWLKANLKD
jgi:hypothetical protein